MAALRTPAPPFPDFVAASFERKYGVGAVVGQNCWDLLYTVHTYRKDQLSVETFARFLEEGYDSDDLLFYLYGRSTVQKELGVSLRGHWSEGGRGGEGGGGAAPPPLTITQRQCTAVSRIIFGSEADPHFKSFQLVLGRHLGKGKAADVPTFLHLALGKYHETRGGAAAGGVGGGGDERGAETEADRLFREAMNAYDDRTRGLGGVAGGGGRGGSAAASATSAGVGGGGAASSTPAGGFSSTPSPALLGALGEAVNSAMERRLDGVLGEEGAGLSAEYVTLVREELSGNLEAKVDKVLQAVIDAAHGEGGDSSSSDVEALAKMFQALVEADNAGEGTGGAVETFCEELTGCAEVHGPFRALARTMCEHARAE